MFGSDQRWSKVIRKHNSGNMCDVCSRRCLTHFVFVPYNSNHIPNMFCHVLPRHALNVNDSEDLRSIGRRAKSYSGTWITSFQYCSPLKMSITLMERNGDSRYSQHCSIWCFHRHHRHTHCTTAATTYYSYRFLPASSLAVCLRLPQAIHLYNPKSWKE